MTWQPIYILGLASMAGAYLGGLPPDQMTIAVSPLAEQVLLNTTDRAEAVKSRVTVPVHDLDGNIKPLRPENDDDDEAFVSAFEELPESTIYESALSSVNNGTVVDSLDKYPPVNFETNDGSVQLKFGSGGSCTLDTLLGRGMSGSVYACDKLAVKFIKGEAKAMQCAKEYELQRRVNSNFVVKTEGAFVLANPLQFKDGDENKEDIPKGSMCIVMEKLDTDLRKMKQHFRGRLGFTKKIWLQVLEGVTALHKADIIYRDLKPDNVLSNHDATEVKISDLGLASTGLEKPRHDLAGTPAYLAPEIVTKMIDEKVNIEYTAAVDAWTLGILLYELYFGKTPFAAGDPRRLYKGILENKVEFPHDSGIPEAPFQMKDLIRKCLEKDPNKRYRVHEKLSGKMPLISSHPFVTGGDKHEQERLKTWLAQHRSDTASSKVSAFMQWVLFRLTGVDAATQAPEGKMEVPDDVLCRAALAAVKQRDVEMVEILVKQGSLENCQDEEAPTGTGKSLLELAKSLYQTAEFADDDKDSGKLAEIMGYLSSR
mmetsp:Transcript_78781/g.144157  ORF Transcript_78781/g.144157 Transcript_78781/m.144157 type:complete len:541 (+) Transcript_78781:77-1699(+)